MLLTFSSKNMDVLDVFKDQFTMPELTPKEAQELELFLTSRLLGFTDTKDLGELFFLDMTIGSRPYPEMKQRSTLKTLLGFIGMPAYEEDGTKVKDMAADETIQKKVDAVFYRAADINKLISKINRVLNNTGDSILTSSKIIAPGQSINVMPKPKLEE